MGKFGDKHSEGRAWPWGSGAPEGSCLAVFTLDWAVDPVC